MQFFSKKSLFVPILLTIFVFAFSFNFSKADSEQVSVVPIADSEEVPVVSVVESVVDNTTENSTNDVEVVAEPTIETEPSIEETTPPVETQTETSTTPTDPTDQTASAVLAPTTAPTLSTDKEDYHPGETATIFGRFFAPLQNFVLKIFGGTVEEENYTESNVSVTSDEEGSFSFDYLLDIVYRPIYTIVASAIDGTQVAITTFLDSPINESPLEVDGNALNTALPLGTDWNDVIGAGCDISENGGGVIKGTCVIDPTSGDQGFHTGGSKDINDLSQWGWSAASGSQTPPKNNIVNAFGAIFNDTNGDQVLYFGLNREPDTNQGNNTVGFWFVQNKVVLAQDGSFDNASGGAATHTDGDLHVVAEFTNGGNISNLRLNKWQNGALVNVSSTSPGTNVGCNATGTVCVGVNNSSSTLSWIGGQVSPAIFFEGAINLTQLNFAINSCISQFIAETRSSAADSAQLHDFALGDLSTCASLTIIKDAQPDSGQDFDFVVSGNGLSNFSLDDDNDNTLSNTKVFANLVPGANRSVVENLPNGWQQQSATCDDNSPLNNIDLSPSENVTCTFINTPQQGKIELQKDFVGGSENVTLRIGTNQNGSSIDSDVVSADGSTGENVVNIGTYFVSEVLTTPADYSSVLACYNDINNNNAVDQNDTQHAVNVNTGEILVSNNEDVLCVYTNTLLTGTLTLQKIVIKDNGGTALDTDWTLSASGPTPIFGVEDNLAVTNAVVNIGTYNLSESSGPAGYTNGTTWDCTGGNQNDGDTVTVAPGQDVSCTITNNDNAPSLTLNKIVINGNGGTALESAWTLSATGPTPISGPGAAGDIDVVSGASFDAGQYVLSESTGPAGYTASGWTCSNNDNDGTINIGLGESVTCSITNTAQPGHLIVHKVTDPVSDTTTQFSITASGGTVVSPNATQNIVGGGMVDYTVHAGTYNITEATKTGWTETSNTCANIVVANGETKHCTITNTQKGHVIIKKNAVPDGSQIFTFNNNFGNGNNTTFTLVDDDTTGLPSYDAEVLPGKYAVSEDPVAGWQLDGTSCDSGETVDDIDVAPGETVTCTFTNQKLAKITLVKNTLGGDGSFDFTTTGAGLSNVTLNTVGLTASAQWIDLDPDLTYSIAETVPAGWDLLSATCDNGDPVNNITPNSGEEITCTFTNEKDAYIIIEKQTFPEGGTETFTFDTNYSADFSLSDNQQNNSGDLIPGNYSVAELAKAGWDLTQTSCTSSKGDNESAASISLQAGETVTCIFTNTQRGSITIYKDVVAPDGVSPYVDNTAFTVNLNGGSTNPNLSENNQVDYLNLAPGTYTVTEDPVTSGYTFVSYSSDSDVDVLGAQIVVLPGEHKEITVKNKLNKINTNIVTEASDSILDLGDSVTDSAVISPINNQIPLTGTVTFFVCPTASCPNGGTQVGNPVPVVNGAATSGSFTPVVPGVYTFRAEYSGDTNYNGSIDINANGKETFMIVVPLDVRKTAHASFTRTFAWDVEKSVDVDNWNLFLGDATTSNYTVKVTKDEGTDSAWVATGTIVIINPNTTASSTITSIVDEISNQVGVATINCPVSLPYEIGPEETLNCTYTKSLSDGDDEINTVTVTTSGEVDGNSATAPVDFGDPSVLVNDKVNVEDSVEGDLGEVSDNHTFNYSKEFSCSLNEQGVMTGQGVYPNTAKIVETQDEDSASVTVRCYELSVSKTAATSLTRTWTWTIDKISSTTVLNLAPDQIYPVYYEVVVGATSADSAWTVNGTITINNPAPMPAPVTVTDNITGVGAVTVNCGGATSVPANGSLECTYTSALPNADARTNTAVATLANGTEFSGTAAISFVEATVNEVDEQITLSDSPYGNLGVVNSTDQLPKTFGYTTNVGRYPSSECGLPKTFVNTATFATIDTGTTGSDSHTVNVNVQCVCSLTQGYWKTHNESFKGGAPADINWFNVDFDGNNGKEGELETFFLSNQTWFQVFWTAPKGNPYYNLAHQYMAAKLNVGNGAYAPGIPAAITSAEDLFNRYIPTEVGKKSNLKKQFTDLAATLGAFNEGIGNPAGHCSEPPL